MGAPFDGIDRFEVGMGLRPNYTHFREPCQTGLVGVQARFAGELTISSGRMSRPDINSPMKGAVRKPRSFSGRSKSARDVSSQLDFACRSRYRRFITLIVDFKRLFCQRAYLLRFKLRCFLLELTVLSPVARGIGLTNRFVFASHGAKAF